MNVINDSLKKNKVIHLLLLLLSLVSPLAAPTTKIFLSPEDFESWMLLEFGICWASASRCVAGKRGLN